MLLYSHLDKPLWCIATILSVGRISRWCGPDWGEAAYFGRGIAAYFKNIKTERDHAKVRTQIDTERGEDSKYVIRFLVR